MIIKVFTLSIIMVLISCGKKTDDTPKTVTPEDRSLPQRTVIDEKSRQELNNAILSSDSLLLEYALNENDDIDYQFVDGETPLTKAIKKSNNVIIAKLINKSKNLNLRNASNETPLNIAIRDKNYNIIHTLIKNNADINQLGHNKMSPLANAIFFCNETESINLVRNGADINMIDVSGLSMLELAQLNGYTRLSTLLEKAIKHKSVQPENMLNAIHQEDKSFIKYLITRFPSYVKIIDENNMLIDVIEIDNEINRRFILDYLLSVGVEAHNINGKNPLILTVEKNLIEEMNALILNGAKINYKNKDGKDAMIVSVENLFYKITKKLYKILQGEINNLSIMFQEQALIDFDRKMQTVCYNIPHRRRAGWIINNGRFYRTQTRRLLKCN